MAEQATEPLLDSEAELGWEDVESLGDSSVTERWAEACRLRRPQRRVPPLLSQGPDAPSTTRCTVQALLEEHEGRGDVLKHLQTKGVVKLGELSCEVRAVSLAPISDSTNVPWWLALLPPVQDKVVFPAFGSEPLLTFGSDQREMDYVEEWQACIRKESERKERSWLRRLVRRADSRGGQRCLERSGSLLCWSADPLFC